MKKKKFHLHYYKCGDPKCTERHPTGIDPKEFEEYQGILEACGLERDSDIEHKSLPDSRPRRRREVERFNDEGEKIEQRAALNFDGSPILRPDETVTEIAVLPGAITALADFLKDRKGKPLSGTARTVLALRLMPNDDLEPITQDDVRQYFLTNNPQEVSRAMSAWRNFDGRKSEIRAFLSGYRCDREVRVKPRYKHHE